jgi:hypothetical protein
MKIVLLAKNAFLWFPVVLPQEIQFWTDFFPFLDYVILPVELFIRWRNLAVEYVHTFTI